MPLRPARPLPRPARSVGATGDLWPAHGRRRAAAAALSLIALVVVAGALVVLVTGSFDRYDRSVRRAEAAQRAADEMLEAMLNQETGLRGFFSTGDARFLEPARAGRRALARALPTVSTEAAPGTRAGVSLTAAIAIAEGWRSLSDAAVRRALDTGGRRRPSLADALARKREMDRFRGEHSRLSGLLAERAASTRAAARRSAVFSVVALTLLLGGALVVVLRVTGRRARRSDARLGALIHSSLDLLTVVDDRGRILYVNPAVERVLGHRPEALAGTLITDLVHPDDRADVLAALARAVAEPGESGDPAICRLRHADGTWRWLESARNNLLRNPDIRGVVLNSRDVTEREMLAAQLHTQAYTDRLTGLANRARFEDELAAATALAGGEAPAATVVMLDLDDFKLVNDSLGHAAGDRLLRAVAGRLAGAVGRDDVLARIGGDEFAILSTCPDAHRTGPALAARCLAALAERIEIDGRLLVASPSIGIAFVTGSATVESAMRNADLALYEAKQGGKGRIATYVEDLHVAALERLELDAELRRAVELDELVLHFQPIFHTDRRLRGFEALVRWNHPRHGLVGPGAFIEAAEANGAIVEIGRWVLGEACRQAKAWQRRYGAELTMAVNVSSAQVEHDAFVGEVAEALRANALDPATIELELTETAITRDLDATTRTLGALKDLGVRIAIDDFGTGHSSLERLQHLPLDTLKIPKPFVDRIATSDDDLAIARGIVALAHGMGLGVVAEGVEDAEQLVRLGAIGCDYAQGFHLARPAAPGSIEQHTLRAPATAGTPA